MRLGHRINSYQKAVDVLGLKRHPCLKPAFLVPRPLFVVIHEMMKRLFTLVERTAREGWRRVMFVRKECPVPWTLLEKGRELGKR
jgi:hypothetical protein